MENPLLKCSHIYSPQDQHRNTNLKSAFVKKTHLVILRHLSGRKLLGLSLEVETLVGAIFVTSSYLANVGAGGNHFVIVSQIAEASGCTQLRTLATPTLQSHVAAR